MPINITIANIARRTALITNAIAVDLEGEFMGRNAAMLKPLADDVEALFMDLQQRSSMEQVGAAVEVLLQAVEVYKDFYAEDRKEAWYPNVLHLGGVIHNTLALGVVRQVLRERLTQDAIDEIDGLLEPKKLPTFIKYVPDDVRRAVPIGRSPRPLLELRANQAQSPRSRGAMQRTKASKKSRSPESRSPSR